MEQFAVVRVSPNGHNPKIKKIVVGVIPAASRKDARNRLKELLDQHGFKVGVEKQDLKLADETLLRLEKAPPITRATEEWLDNLWKLNVL